MTIGKLKDAIANLDDDFEIEVVVPVEDADGDETDRSFRLALVTPALDPDTGDNYVAFECEPNL